MINSNYANAYKEVLVVLDNLVDEDYEKIPNEYINFFKSNANNAYEFKYDYSKSFDEQDLLDDTKYILFGLFEKFWTTEIQKSKIKEFKKCYNEQLENEKLQKYNPDNLFKNPERVIPQKPEKVAMIEYEKDNVWKKLKRFISKILNKKGE